MGKTKERNGPGSYLATTRLFNTHSGITKDCNGDSDVDDNYDHDDGDDDDEGPGSYLTTTRHIL